MNGYQIPSTTSPCPDWCQLEPGHEYDSVDHDGRPVRSHERIIAEAANVTVALVQTEVEVSNALETFGSRADPELWVDSGEPLTGPQARELARWLTVAADEWDSARSETERP